MADSSDSEDDVPIGKLKAVKRKREAAADNGDDDSDDEDVPLTKLKASNSVGGGSSTKRRGSSGKKQSYKEEDSDEDEEDAFESPKKKKKTTKKLTKRKPADSEGDESEDDGIDHDDEDEDMDDDFVDEEEEEAGAKRRGSGKKKATKKASASRAKGKAKPRTKAAPSTKGKATKKAAPKKETVRKVKELTKLDKIEQALKAYKWWEAPALPEGRQWYHLEHNGINFPPNYEPHGVRMLYNGEEVDLTPAQEELATFFAKEKARESTSPQLSNPDTAAKFTKNFFDDWKQLLGSGHTIRKFRKCDFGPIVTHLNHLKEVNQAKTDLEKQELKNEKQEIVRRFGLAICDGHLEKVGTMTVEPPGLFLGRGNHPLMGKYKKRTMPHSLTLNIGESAATPACNVPGFAWECVQHKPNVVGLASWKENVLGSNKYVQLSAASSFKGKSDMDKYDKAMKLMGYIEKIRADYTKTMKSTDRLTRQIATAVWIIDRLALRVGGEKGEDEADTVGCCSLRVEHLSFSEDANAHEIELEFLGKDSMLFKQNIDFEQYGEVGLQVFMNLQGFVKKKRPAEDVLENLTPGILNQHLQSLMPGLSAKVFRTFNASFTLQNELPKAEDLKGLNLQEIIVEYNAANKKVAILCNHQRTVSTAAKESLDTFNGKLETLKQQRKELKEMKKLIASGKEKKVVLKDEDKSLSESISKALQDSKDSLAKATTVDQKLAASSAKKEAMKERKELAGKKFDEMHLFAKTPSAEQVDGRIKKWAEKIAKMETDIRDKNENKEVALGTSKKNYMDPRITVAWCKRNEVPIEKVFPKTLRDQFVWSMNVPPDWAFSFQTIKDAERKSAEIIKKALGGGGEEEDEEEDEEDGEEEEEEEEEEEG